MENLYDELQEGEPAPLPAEPREFPGHPLFPLPEGVKETREIIEISFDRWDHQGRKERCPDRFSASEITSLGQIVDMFGGGTYQFMAYSAKGQFVRWASERIRVALPCKPLRPIELEGPIEATPARAPAPTSAPDLVPLLIASQERADRVLATLLERIASPPPAPPPAPAMDPITMMTGLATIMEKLRPPQPSGDMIGQLSGLVGIAKQLGGKNSTAATEDPTLQPILTMMTNAMAQNAATPAAPEARPAPASAPRSDLVWVDVPKIGPVMMRIDQAASYFARSPQGADRADAPPPAATPTTSAVHQPATSGPVPQATTAAAQASQTSNPAGYWDDVASRLKDPEAQSALKQAIERALTSGAAPPPVAAKPSAPTAEAAQPTEAAPVASTAASASRSRSTQPARPAEPAPIAPRVAEAVSTVPAPSSPDIAAQAPPVVSVEPQASDATAPTAAEAQPVPAAPLASGVAPQGGEAPAGAKCLFCGSAARADRDHPDIVVCANNHRSLLAASRAPADDSDQLVPLDTIATEDIEAILGDAETTASMPPEMVASFRREAEARKTTPRHAEAAA